jgi:outer membrane protein OmpA-like peptidoglycan-associated protein
MKKIVLLIAVFFAALFTAESQNTERPWLIGVSTNFVDFNAVHLPVGEQFTNANWMGKTFVSQFKIARTLSKEIVVAAEFSMVKLDKDKLNAWPDIESPISTNNFWRLQGQFEYKFANGYLLNQNSFIDPYVFLGVNGSNISEQTYVAQSTGLGLNVWITDWIGVNFEASYDYVFDWNDYFHYSAGVVAKFGKMSDKDNDGISDKKDACPNIAGLAEFQGCPDTDKDGIADKDDYCPMVAGPKSTNGCPDSDGDGVLDKDDKCPDVAGMAQYSGCPDTDGDGIIDKEDKCPNEKGLKENDGCPVVAVAKIDSVKVKEIDSKLKSFSDYIEFETSKYVIKPKSYQRLNDIVKLMQEHPDARFAIEGHTDNVGGKTNNQVLSESRAYALRQYLVDKGIDPERLTFKGYGETRPRATNSTPEGRAQNRRVEIRYIQ